MEVGRFVLFLSSFLDESSPIFWQLWAVVQFNDVLINNNCKSHNSSIIKVFLTLTKGKNLIRWLRFPGQSNISIDFPLWEHNSILIIHIGNSAWDRNLHKNRLVMTTIHHQCKKLNLDNSQIKHRHIFSIWNKSMSITLCSKHYFIYFLNIGQTNPLAICLIRDFFF